MNLTIETIFLILSLITRHLYTNWSNFIKLIYDLLLHYEQGWL